MELPRCYGLSLLVALQLLVLARSSSLIVLRCRFLTLTLTLTLTLLGFINKLSTLRIDVGLVGWARQGTTNRVSALGTGMSLCRVVQHK